MKVKPLTIKIMTAGLVPGDAIGNYIMSKRRIFQQWGARVELYADHIAPAYHHLARPSLFYHATGEDILWFHYSIYSDNVELALASPDFKIMDYHGITPPHLFAGQNANLEYLCRKGAALLPALRDQFEQYVVHTEYTRQQLSDLGFARERLHKIFYCVDTSQFDGQEDEGLSSLLPQMEYLLFVGRLVGQKDILAMIEIFARVQAARPDTVLVLVGSRALVPRYQEEIDSLIAAKGLEKRVLFTGQVNNPAVLGALFRHARFTIITSEWESFCVPIAESAFFGTPPAVCDLPPMPEVAGPAGIVFDKGKPQEAARQILEVMEDDPRYRELSERALSWSQQYTDEALERNLLHFLEQLAA